MATIATTLHRRIAQLLQAKDRRQRVDNELHDTATELAQVLLADRFPDRSWLIATKNQRGIDVQGYIGDKLDVACEVTTHRFLSGNMRKQINEDLVRLQNTGAQSKSLAIVHAEILVQLNRMRVRDVLKGITVIDLPAGRFEELT